MSTLRLNDDGTLPMTRDANGHPIPTAGTEELLDVSGSAFIAGTLDPTAGAGVAADPGSIYARNNAGVGQLWLKLGTADTAWTEVISSG